MKYIIDKEKRPLYLQIYKQIRDDIIAGIFSYNTKLPSKRNLAEETGVSTITVEHAYALLCDEGYVEARERIGFVVIFRKTDGFAVSVNIEVPHSVNHTENTYPDFPISVLNKTMRKVLTEQGELLLEKSPNRGCVQLREAIKRYLARNRGIIVDTEQIIIGSGSEYLYGLIVELLGRNLTYAIESPSYKKIEQVYKATEIAYCSLPLTSSGIDSNALAKTDAHVLHTTPYRSYPSGVTATASKRHEYIRWAERDAHYIIEDDFESEFSVLTKPTETLFALSNNDNVIYLNTFSKTISPSLRIGYMVLPKHLLKVFDEKLGFYSCTVPTFMQHVLTELIDNGDFERHINRVRRRKRKELSNK
ncbi:MAG: PLP-dependent aminotransferase family protein [Clostridia bacterium]|nr:PLP-dependent aminotransferase family protein [Clostridia bacterium]MBQ2274787.1 PLP-dependent aminotransferase family protein [Clostridia bacterium]MEE1278614.1 PLP-dependent aminotransferase family protein [Acutalibacteraceae bacterium]